MLVVGVSRARETHTHLQTPVTLCREQSIRGYVSKVKSVGVPRAPTSVSLLYSYKHQKVLRVFPSGRNVSLIKKDSIS